ncbi:two-component system sensor histidine kinase NtrB [Fundidesulfovibrio terrae]|uniref:two-component system sensor histidine kinase NtrB n=1 Tax=Fundidesulfovibrio terrae TaxID=2922866 RepID=UPI001FB01D0B|nr:ATP-binding protein [Fundidesulfovibrio terrae]
MPETLRGQGARRMVLASLAMLLVASLAGQAAYDAVLAKSARYEAKTVETFYAGKLLEWDEDWQSQAEHQKARLAFLGLAENPAARRERLHAYYLAQGEDPKFSHVFLMTADGTPLFWYGPEAKRMAALTARSPGANWLHDESSGLLYRVYSQPFWLGPEGMGRIVMLRVLDNALLYQNTSTRTDLRLVWQGRVVASSLRSTDPDAPAGEARRVEVELPWPGGGSPAPVLRLSHYVDAPVSGLEVAAAVACLLALQALCIWGVLGRWLVRIARRLALLGGASREQARGWASGRPAPLDLDEEMLDRDDEIATVALSLKSLTQAVAHHDAQRLAGQEELGRLRNLLSEIIDSMPSALITVDLQGRITRCNRLALESSGFEEHEAEGMRIEEVFPRLAAELAPLHEAMRGGVTWTGHKIPRRVAGDILYEDVTIYPLANSLGVEGAVIRLDDVTKRHQMELMMVQSEKMLSVGGLAAGMAHEINNPLGGILQSAQVMRRRITDDLPQNLRMAAGLGCPMETIRAYMEGRGVLDMLAGITESAQRAAKIVRGMLEFSRRGDSPFEPVDIRGILEKALELCSKDYDFTKHRDFRRIRIERDYDPDLPPVPCSATQIEQVVMNLLRNAAQAMTANPEHRPPAIILRTRREDGQALITVEDNGPGLSDAARKRIFEPFYTTKPPGMGTGLGLSVSYFIVTENHGGSMSAHSEPGRWTRISVRLPLAVKELRGAGGRDPGPG